MFDSTAPHHAPAPVADHTITAPAELAETVTRRQLHIGVDLDNVCYPFPAVLRRWVHHRTGKPLEEMPEPTTWHFYDNQWGLSAREYLRLAEEAVDARVLFRHGAPLPGSAEAIRKLVRDGHHVHIISARGSFGLPGLAEELTHQWLRRWRIPYGACILAGEKGTAGTELGLHTAIDDAAHHYDEYEEAGIAGFLLDRPWNAEHPGRRVSDWGAYLDVVDRLARTT
jgi:hypothetical protein